MEAQLTGGAQFHPDRCISLIVCMHTEGALIRAQGLVLEHLLVFHSRHVRVPRAHHTPGAMVF